MRFVCLLPATLLAVAAAAPVQAQDTRYPLTFANCGHTLAFERAPASVVTVGQAGTEVLYALGLGDKVLGTALWFNPVLPAHEAINAKVERLADNLPSFEAVIGKRPALVVSQFEWGIGPEGVVATREQFHDLNIPTYAMPADCESKDNLSGSDGTRAQMFDVKSIYKSIEQLAEIFDVQPKGAALIQALSARQDKAVARVKATGLNDLSAALWFSSADMAIDPYIAGSKGVAGYMMHTLGLRNVVQSDEEWPLVGWETLAKANPSILIIARMDRRRFPADDYEKKLEFLKSDPVTQHMDAVKHDRIVVVNAEALQGSFRLVEGMEEVAEAVEKLQASLKN